MRKNILLLYLIFALNILLFFFFLLTNSYPFFAILINIGSVLSLLVWIAPHTISSYKKINTFDSIMIVCLFLLAFCVYLYKIDVITPGIQGDEVTIAKTSEQILTTSQFLPFVPVNLGHPTPLLYLTGISIRTFGRSIMAIRLPYVIFGALCIAAFYILLRLFFNKPVSIAASLLMLFSYPFVIVSRLAYETAPQIFFQILTTIFLYLAWKTKHIRYFVAIGLTLGLGMYTYLGFRTFAVGVLLLTIYLIFKISKIKTANVKFLFVLLASLFIVCVPLLSYSLTHAQDIMARTTSLSPFNQGFSPAETVSELGANVGRLSHLFFMGDPKIGPNGDTNFETNPSNVSMFDIGTFIFLIIGFIYLFKTDKKLCLIVMLFLICALANDIFVIIKIPEAMHPYGVGHPNTLRISGIIPIIYFTIAYGLNRLILLLNKGEMNFSYTPYIFVAFIIINNWYLYFEQPTDAFYSYWIDKYNGANVMNLVNFINRSNVSEAAISPTIASDERFTYFIKNNIRTKPFTPKNYTDAIHQAKGNQLTIFDTATNTLLAVQMLSQDPPVGLQIIPVAQSKTDLNHSIYAIVLVKTQ